MTPNLDVQILCSSRELFGADRSALRLARVVQDLGHSVQLALPSHRPEMGLAREAEEKGIRVYSTALAIASSSGVEGLVGVCAAEPRSADVVIANSSAILASRIRAPTRLLMLREWFEEQSVRHRLLAARHRLTTDAVIGVSGGVVEQWRRCVRGPRRQFVVHNWLEPDVLNPALEMRHAGAGVVCLGRFNRWKGQEVLASAYEQAFGSYENPPGLTFVGAQPGTAFAPAADAIRERGKRYDWAVVDFVRDPADYLRKASLLVMPSLHPEPFGMVALEAVAHGCRVIAFPGGGADDLSAALPGIVDVVPRTVGALAQAMRDWFDASGRGQTDAQMELSRIVLQDQFSHFSALRNWERVLEQTWSA